MAKTKRISRTKNSAEAVSELMKHCTLETSVLLQPDVYHAFQIVLGNLEAINIQEFLSHNLIYLCKAVEHEVIRRKAEDPNYCEDELNEWLDAIVSGDIEVNQPKSIRRWLETSYETFLQYVGTWSK